jgi:hypothetical protein
MADNIKIVGQVLDTERINRYTAQEEQLLNPILNQETFGLPQDYIEYFLFDQGGNVLNSDYNYNSYKLPSNSAYSQSLLPDIEIDPIKDIQDLGYESGEVVSRYNFFRKISSEPFSNQLFIQQISTDRTELRVDSTELTDEALIDIAENFANKQIEVPYYYYVILNFGDNNQVVAVNIISEVDQTGNVSILFKLYEPLPANISLKSTFWIVEEIVNPYVFNLNLDKLTTPLPQPFLKGPNFDIDLEIKEVVPTAYSNLNQLVTSFTGSSYQAVLNSLTNQNVNINVDYSTFNDFIHYSSAASRVNNFLNKVGEIEGYQSEISTLSPLTSSNASLINQINRASSSLNAVIGGFDGFETYLYYTSSSLTSSITTYTLESGPYFVYNVAPYPKSNTTKPYTLYASSSITVQSWYNDTIEVAGGFDINNKDILVNTIPSYITDDSDNYLPYIVFVEMIGQYFDNVWIYIDKLTDVWDNNNNLNEGISQDLVYDWLQSFGMKLYNSQGNQNVLNYNVGGFSGSVDFAPNCVSYRFTNTGSFATNQNFINCNGISSSTSFINPFGGTETVCALSGSFAPLTAGVRVTDLGPCYNGNYSPSSSFLNNVPRKDLVLDTYKRLYHNLPYLFKGKGAHGGLQGLITLFGITGSILPIKEYGGTNDYQDLKGYTTDKISIGSNNITGSILSPIKRLETTTTSSREVKSQDLHFIDVSFSPQTQIDKAVSASIAASNPSWVIDDYIGYPQALYMDNYPSLSYQRDYWFGQTFTHPNEGFDYAGFIRLIQFFDNSLFKMVKDFTPARGNTWTGVSIKSPVLERPKVPEARPVSNIQIDLDGAVTGAAIVPIYDPYYEYLSGDKVAYYNGEISGSFIDTYAYFEENNINPYLVNNTAGVVPPGFMGGSTEFILNYDAPFYENFFYNSSFNALFNNVSKSLKSEYRKKLTPIMSADSLGRVFTSYSIEESVDLQDSYLSLQAYTNPRYNGVQLYGRINNVWTPGDVSYGQSPVITHNTKKLGLFTEVVNSILPYKSDVKLKYLVNEVGGFTELNQRNRNWQEVQNTFKAGNSLNISLFNSQQYSNQTQTNGNKLIYESGYSYFPTFYMYGSESANFTSQSIFNTLGGGGNSAIVDRFFTIYPSGGLLISGGVNPLTQYVSSSYLGSGRKHEVWNMFDLTAPNSNTGLYFSAGTGPGTSNKLTSSYYTLSSEGDYMFTYNFSVLVDGPLNSELTASMQLWKENSLGVTSVITESTQSLVAKMRSNYYDGILSSFEDFSGPTQYVPDSTQNKILLNGYTLYSYDGINPNPISTEIFLSDTLFSAYKVYTYVGNAFDESFDNGLEEGNNPNLVDQNNIPIRSYYAGTIWIKDGSGIPGSPSTPKYTFISPPFSVPQPQTLTFNRNTLVEINQFDYTVGDKIGFRFFVESNVGLVTASLLRTTDNILQVVPTNDSLLVSTSSICINQSINAFYLSPQLSPFFSTNYIFNPLDSLVSSSYADLYLEYGDILYPFVLQENDKVIVQVIDENGPFLEYTVSNVIYAGNGQVYIQTKEDISGYFEDRCNKFYKIAFLKRVNDETNIIVNLTKPDGKTSYGFSIPQNIAQNVLNNIDVITVNTKQQLIDAGINLTQ